MGEFPSPSDPAEVSFLKLGSVTKSGRVSTDSIAPPAVGVAAFWAGGEVGSRGGLARRGLQGGTGEDWILRVQANCAAVGPTVQV